MRGILIILLGLTSFVASAQWLPKQSNPPRLVEDRADVLSPGFEKRLENHLTRFSDTTSNQILVVTLDDLNGREPAELATEIGHAWGVGSSQFDNGIVVLIKPKRNSRDRGHVFIATGYGLEGAIPDITANHIIQNEMMPELRKGDYEAAVHRALLVLEGLAVGEYNSDQYMSKKRQASGGGVVVLFFILFAVVSVIRSRARRSYDPTGRSSALWTALFLGSAMNRRHGGYYDSFRSGGGGFGGFGGGGFGGGGAGGSW